MMEVRKGTPQDIDELSRLYDDLNDYLDSHMNYPGWKKGIYPAREDAEQGVRENSLFVASENGGILGTVILRHRPEVGYESADWGNAFVYEEIFVLYTLAVHPTCLKQGIGRDLVQFACDYAAAKKMNAIRLDVYAKNTPAIRLYESMGFQYIDTVDLGYGMYGLDYFNLYQKLL